jgi:hypothetical protein
MDVGRCWFRTWAVPPTMMSGSPAALAAEASASALPQTPSPTQRGTSGFALLAKAWGGCGVI